jgi:hypothetical protein
MLGDGLDHAGHDSASARSPATLDAMPRPRDVVVAVQPDEALLASVAVLRHLGARITRYDAEAGTLEARLRRYWRSALIRLRAEADGAATRLTVESDALGWAPLFRRFRGGLLHVVRSAS